MKREPLHLNFSWARLWRWRPPELRFDKLEEAHFQYACSEARLQHFIKSGILALLAFNLFLFADHAMIPDVFDVAVHFRVLVFTPLALVLLLFGIRLKAFVLLLPSFVLELFLLATGAGAAWSMGWLLLQSHSDYAGMYVAGLVPITIYGNLVQRFRFRYALSFSCFVIGVAAHATWVRAAQAHHYAVLDVPLMLMVSLVACYTLIMNYRFELEERRRFQWAVRAQALHKRLAASQEQLDELSRRDPLTGVPNRRHFDAYLRAQWDAAALGGGPGAGAGGGATLALLLIDVDHFKHYNDRYGHPAGDQCLKHVAQALAAQVPEDSGCVARWGGEEFIVALPGADVAQAMKVAQGLCEAVSALGLRHEASSTASCVTISVGVAVALPAKASGTPDTLVASADAALYRAKEAGRNRAVAALTPVPVPA